MVGCYLWRWPAIGRQLLPLAGYAEERAGPYCLSGVRRLAASSSAVGPYFSPTELRARRLIFHQLVCEKLRHTEQTKGNSCSYVAVLPAAVVLYSSHHIPYRFRQETDFRYFTGLTEPDAFFVVTGDNRSNKPKEEVLFVADPDPHKDLWEGPRPPKSSLQSESGIDDIRHHRELSEWIERLIVSTKPHVAILSPPAYEESMNRTVRAAIKSLRSISPGNIVNLKSVTHRQRLVKSPAESKLLTDSARIASVCLERTMKRARDLRTESQMAAHFEYEVRMEASTSGHDVALAFPCVTAAGNNANTIHYLYGSQEIHDEDSILFDCGVELDGYCSDTTRTFPKSGRFTLPQERLYSALLYVQSMLLDMCRGIRPLTLVDLHLAMGVLLAEQLQKLGIIDPKMSQQESLEASQKYCPHACGHYLGMDVHDSETVGRSEPLVPGMVVTVEPGLYVRKDDLKAPPEYRGIGMRIEDDILITEGGCEVLTTCPKELTDIYKAMS